MKRLPIILWILLIASSAFPQWTCNNGPEGVSIGSLAAIDGTIYAGTGVEGLYASTDDGLNWTPLNTGIENQDVTAVARDQGWLRLAEAATGYCGHTDVIIDEKVTTLINEFKESGNHKVKFNATTLSSGVYFYKLNAGEFTSIKKMIILK